MCLPLLEQGHGRCSRYRQPQLARKQRWAGPAATALLRTGTRPAWLGRGLCRLGRSGQRAPFQRFVVARTRFPAGIPRTAPSRRRGRRRALGLRAASPRAGCGAARHPEPRGGPWASELRIRWEGSSSGRKQTGPAACLRVPDRRAWSASSGGTMGGHPGRPGHPRGEAGVETRGQKPVCGRAAQLCRKGLGGRRCLCTRVAGHTAGVAATQRPAASRQGSFARRAAVRSLLTVRSDRDGGRNAVAASARHLSAGRGTTGAKRAGRDGLERSGSVNAGPRLPQRALAAGERARGGGGDGSCTAGSVHGVWQVPRASEETRTRWRGPRPCGPRV